MARPPSDNFAEATISASEHQAERTRKREAIESTHALTNETTKNLSTLFRSSMFPGSVIKFPQQSITKDLLQDGQRKDKYVSYSCLDEGKAHNRKKHSGSAFDEAESASPALPFLRRNLMKAIEQQNKK